MSTLAITIVQQSDNTYKIFFFFLLKECMLWLKWNPVEPASLHTLKRIPHMNASRVSAGHVNVCVIMGSKILSVNSSAHDDTHMIYWSPGFTASKVFTNGIKPTGDRVRFGHRATYNMWKNHCMTGSHKYNCVYCIISKCDTTPKTCSLWSKQITNSTSRNTID